MPGSVLSPITPIVVPHLLAAPCQQHSEIPRTSGPSESVPAPRRGVARQPARILIRPQAGFYVMRLQPNAPLVPAVIYQLCPMVIPQPMIVVGPHPDEWCRPLDRSPRYEARLDSTRVDLDRVWTARSLRRVSRTEFEFRSGTLRRWARENPSAPEAMPERQVDLGAIPPLF
jgi:hypothetical protein